MAFSGGFTVARAGRRKRRKSLLRDREVIVKSSGRFAAFRISRSLQVGIAMFAVATVAWVTFVSAEYLAQGRPPAIRESTVSISQAAHDAALADLATQRREADALAGDVSHLVTRLDNLQSVSRDTIGHLGEKTERIIADWKRLIERTGLDVKKFLAALSDSDEASGGPFLQDSGGNGSGTPIEHGLAQVEKKLNDLARLRHAVSRLPLTVPLNAYAVSSGFGRRRDPINKRVARHEGIDLVAPLGSPVYATAPGVVTFAGRKGRYGNFVEINHGAGLRTRFAHLKKVLVKKGQKVTFRHKIALLGNTGRSTGPHLHYEVLVDGTPRNPMKFIEAGRYVFQNQ